MRMELQKINYKNEKLKVEINCFIDKKNEIWFRGKEIALILDYENTQRAIRKYVHDDDKKLIDFKISTLAKSHNSSGTNLVREAGGPETTRKCVFINESGFYSLILSSKQPKAKEFKHWVTSKVLPSIRKRGFYDTKNRRLVIDTEYDLHTKVVSFIRDKYPEAIMIAGLGENQRTSGQRIESWKKGYMAGQSDLILMNPTSKYNSFCLEFKSPTGNYQVSEKQLEMKERYIINKCKYLMSNHFENIMYEVIIYLEESRKYIKK